MAGYLPVDHPWAFAFLVCAIAAALEGMLAGTKIKERFAELQLPRPSPRLWVWQLIGVAYYMVFFLLIHNLIGNPPIPIWTTLSLLLVSILLGANAAWNWVFFRKGDLWLSTIYFGPYVLIAICLALVLFHIGNPLAVWYLLYVGYLGYVTWWIYGVWRLNRSRNGLPDV